MTQLKRGSCVRPALMTDLPIHYAKMAGNINVTRRGSGPDCTELYERGRKQ